MDTIEETGHGEACEEGVRYRIACVGVDRADAEVAQRAFKDGPQYDGVFLETYLATPGKPLTGLPIDRVVYGPKADAFVAWLDAVVLTRLKPDAEGRRG